MKRRAFTLPEVLATLVLIALVMPAVMQGISLVLRASSDAGKRSQAASLAEAKLAELALRGDSVRETSGDFGSDWPGFQWTRAETGVEDSMVELTVEVQWETRGQTRSLALTTWRAPEATP